MIRLPIIPTIIVAAAVAMMISLGFWQLRRADEKAGMLAAYRAAATLPALDLDPLIDRPAAELPPFAFRRVLITCRAIDAKPDLRGGRSQDGAGGYSYFLPCRPGASGLAGRLRINAGWAAMPDGDLRLSLDGIVAGQVGAVPPEGPITISSATAAGPLTPSTPPSIENIPNNHLSYALQWFLFAATAAIIYVLALRLKTRGKLVQTPLPRKRP